MKKFSPIILILIGAFLAWERHSDDSAPPANARTSDEILAQAFENETYDLQVEGEGEVVRILSDDNEGSRHQRFILELSSGQRVLVAHNIDLAPRVTDLRQGDTVAFYGEFEWNAKGGVIHWTHHDPQRRHVGGWLKHAGRTYQ